MEDLMSPEEKETSLYLVQIQYLDKELESCQLKCDDLEKQNSHLSTHHRALEKDRDDIVEYLRGCVSDSEARGKSLSEQIELQLQTAEREREDMRLEHRDKMAHMLKGLHQLESESRLQAAKSEDQLEQIAQLMQQISNLQSMKQDLIRQEESNKAALHRLRDGAEMAREKLIDEHQRTAVQRVNAQTLSIVQGERAQHTQREDQLDQLLNHNRALWKERDMLRDIERERGQERDGFRRDIDRVTLEMGNNKKDMKQLKKKCKHLQSAIMNCSVSHKNMLVVEEDLSCRLCSVSEGLNQRTLEVSRLQEQLLTESSRRGELEQGVLEGVLLLRHITTDSLKAYETRWRLERLLDILQTTAPQGEAPTFNQSDTRQLATNLDPKTYLTEAQNLTTDPMFLMTRYRPGDFGLVPRPTWRSKTSALRTSLQTSSSQLTPNSQSMSSFEDLSIPETGCSSPTDF